MQRFGLQTEGILLREGDALDVVSIFKDLDRGSPLVSAVTMMNYKLIVYCFNTLTLSLSLCVHRCVSSKLLILFIRWHTQSRSVRVNEIYV